MSRSSWPLAAAVFALIFCPSTTARANDNAPVVPAFDFRNEGHEYLCNEPIKIEIREFDAQQFPHLRARMFRGNKASLPDTPYKMESVGGDVCYVYASVDAKKCKIQASVVDIGAPPRTWTTDEDWLIVLEKSGDWQRGPIKILRKDVRAYFAKGYQCRVSCPRREKGPSLLGQILGAIAEFLGPQPPSAKAQAATAVSWNNQLRNVAAEANICVHFVPMADQGLWGVKMDCGGGQAVRSEMMASEPPEHSSGSSAPGSTRR